MKRIGLWIAVLGMIAGAAGAQGAETAKTRTPILKPAETRKVGDYFRKLCDFIAKEKTACAVIFIGGYYMRDLVAGYRIYGEKRYLDTAIAYADGLLKKQSARGYWETGYGRIYLADTGSALGLFIVLAQHVDAERRKQYTESIRRYVEAIERDGLVRPGGALDVGLGPDENKALTKPYAQDYTISSALTGGEIFTWLYRESGREHYRDVAHGALAWIFNTMRADGVIPYNHPGGKSDLRIKGNKANDAYLWERSPYLTSAYVGEGVLSFDLYCAKPEWRKEIRERIKPHIEYVLRTQNADGSWAKPGPWDQKRSPGIVNMLVWYYTQVEKDPRIVESIRKFANFILVPENAKAFGMLNEGAVPGEKELNSFDCVTGLTGRALADIVAPGVDAEW